MMRIECPRGCSGGSSNRQHSLTDIQIAKISDRIDRQALDPLRPLRCSYCGCVHIDDLGARRVIGTLRDEWVPMEI